MNINKPIFSRMDGTYVATVNGYPYHLIDGDPLKAEVEAYLAEHPEALEPEPLTPPPPPPTLDRILAMRRSAYQLEADPLFFGWQRGENTEQEWLDKISEIKARYPKV